MTVSRRYRSHTCGALTLAEAGADARLSGWCHRIRDHGGVLFIDLRDHYGMTQCVVDPDSPAFAAAEKLRAESVVRFDGLVRKRPDGTENPDMPTGQIELYVREIEVLGPAGDLPLPVFGDQPYPEDTRLRYRFLDLRREKLHKNIVLRGKVVDSMRQRMKAQGFSEFQTPILTASSPEGARDFLVPSRIHAGKFYALPQAPQQYKQLLMMAGFDRYFQIAPCFRDEDPRADRLPGEFYQLDIEMSFVEQEDVFAAMEPVIRGVFEEFADGKPVTPSPWPRIPYAEAMRKYGSDKPDLRNPIVMQERLRAFPRLRLQGVRAAAGDGEERGLGDPRARRRPAHLCRPHEFLGAGRGPAGARLHPVLRPRQGRDDASPDARRDRRRRARPARQQHRPGAGGSDPPAARALRPATPRSSWRATRINSPSSRGWRARKLGQELKLVDEARFEFAWVVDFPMFEWNEEEKKVDFSHNPFSMPQGGLEALQSAGPADDQGVPVRHRLQRLRTGLRRHPQPSPGGDGEGVRDRRLRRADGVDRFGGMYRAFQYGAPPHGGMAAGVDRIVMLLAGEQNLREVALFPMNQRAEDLLMGAPSAGDAEAVARAACEGERAGEVRGAGRPSLTRSSRPRAARSYSSYSAIWGRHRLR